MKTLTSCPSCDSLAISFAFLTEDFFTRSSGRFSVWRCDVCNLHFLNPRPTPTELVNFYPDGYYSFQGLVESPRPLYRRLLRSLAPFRAWNVLWDQVNKGGLWGRTTPRNAHGGLLDVGCGAGAFLSHVRKLNPDLRLVGCDPFGPDLAPLLSSQGIGYHRLPVEGCAFGTGLFNFVTMNHVIEHQPTPGKLLDEIYRILSPGGQLHIGVPNTEGAGRRLFGRYWVGWDVPRHLVSFGRSSLVEMLSRHGFQVKSVRHLSNSGHLLDSLTYRIFGQSDPSYCWKHELGQQALCAVLNPIAGLTNVLALGDNLEVICTRS